VVLVHTLLEMSSRKPPTQSTPRGRPNPQTSQMMQPEGWQFEHW